jgi:iron complex outermembrane receptor protein
MPLRTRRFATVLMLGGASLAALSPMAAASAQTATQPASAAPVADPGTSLPAQSPSVSDGAGQAIVVTGTRASLNRSLDLKKQVIGIVDSISAEDIGKFPDQNVAESLQHIPGVSIDRSGGEGHTITVRGFGPQFNTVLLNNRLLATENPGREFSFDILPSELISAAEVYKSSTADLQDGGIGSTVILRTARPLDHPGFHASASAAAKFDSTRNKGTPNGSALISDTNEDNTFGILASVDYDKRSSRFTDVDTSGWIAQPTINSDGTPWLSPDHLHGATAAPGTNVYLPRSLNLTSTQQQRERIGGTLAMDWVVSDKLKLEFDGLYTQLKIHSVTNQVGWYTDPGDIQDATFNSNGTATNFVRKADGGLKTDNILSTAPEDTHTYQLGINARWTPADHTTVVVDLSHSRAHNRFNSIFDVVGETNPGVNPTFNLNPGSVPTMTGLLPTFDPNRAYLHCCSERGSGVTDDVWQANIDGKQDFDRGILSNIKFGVSGTRRKKSILSVLTPSPLDCYYCGYYATANPSLFSQFSPGSILGEPAISWLNYNHPALVQYEGSPAAVTQNSSAAAQANYNAVYAADGSSTAPIFDPKGSGAVRELTGAVYLQAELKGDMGQHNWDAVVGGRYVYTNELATGNSVELISIAQNPGDPTASVATFSPPVSVSQKSHYGYFLPSATFRFNWSPTFDLRAAVSRTLTRPTLTQLTLSQSFTFRPPAQSSITAGNPLLKPYLAWNYDVGIDYYMGRTSYVSLAGFYKKISNFVSEGTFPETILGEQFLITQPINANKSTVYGFEATVQYTFDKLLPAPFDGLGVSGNYTKVESLTSFDPSLTTQIFNVEGLSDSANAIIFYEKGRVQVRAAYNWRAPFLRSTFGDNGQPTNVDSYGQLDLSGSFKLTKNVSVFMDVVNVTDAKQRIYSSFGERFSGLYDTGRVISGGVRATF